MRADKQHRTIENIHKYIYTAMSYAQTQGRESKLTGKQTLPLSVKVNDLPAQLNRHDTRTLQVGQCLGAPGVFISVKQGMIGAAPGSVNCAIQCDDKESSEHSVYKIT